MKKFMLVFAALGAVTVFGSAGLPFDYGIHRTNDITQDLRTMAHLRPEGNRLYAAAFADANWTAPGNLKVVKTDQLKKGNRYPNSLYDKKFRPLFYGATAEGGELIVCVEAVATAKQVWVKHHCLNLTKRVPGVVVIPHEVQTTTDINQAIDIDVEIIFNLVFQPKLTASASTAPINITINNTTAAPPLMMMGGTPTFFYTSNSNSLITGNWCWGVRGNNTNININNVNKNVNQNSNSNSNSNANNNTNVNQLKPMPAPMQSSWLHGGLAPVLPMRAYQLVI